MRAIVSLAAIATLLAALVIQTARPVRPETLLLRVPGCRPLLRQRRLQCERSCRARGRAQSLSEIETLAGAAPSTIQIHLDGVRVYPSYGCSSVSPWEWFDIFHRASPSLAPYWREGEGGPAVGQEFVPATCECVGSVPLPAVESDAEENAEAEVEADNANDGASPEHGSLPAGEAAQQDKPADGTMREASRDSSVQSWLQPHAQEPGLRAGAASLCAPRDCTAGDGGVRHGNTAPLPSPPPPPPAPFPASAGTSTAGSYTLSHQSKSRRRNARVFGADLAGKDSGYAVRAVGAHLWDQHGDRIKQVHGMRKCMRMSMWRVRM